MPPLVDAQREHEHRHQQHAYVLAAPLPPLLLVTIIPSATPAKDLPQPYTLVPYSFGRVIMLYRN